MFLMVLFLVLVLICALPDWYIEFCIMMAVISVLLFTPVGWVILIGGAIWWFCVPDKESKDQQ